ncbi:G-D-S-L family lipolytic protein [Robertkochia marina]|uniref:G-D-S-L family lipolytic protein n=1 Tax=Robertkochia marina TaxID=1227945 RepID=A0A4S3M1I4_9FLAO|nr:G-D-S-L family lipolytic protein [Robertkochia marina]THD68954.1 G-D-S-L family lipolytic protein [Robertkochia marina]TRZ44773.1 G-D-S-L family lipolytic protein [Robertkochia marina]
MRKLLYISAALALFSSCEPEFNEPVDEVGFYDQGEVDLTNYVALGNSLTSGYADGALYLDAQQSSYPNILASKFALAGGGDFTQPLMNDNIGGLLLNGTPIAATRLVLNFDQNGNPLPVNLEGTPTTEVTNTLEGPFNNMAVPGAKSYHLVAPGYGNIAGIGTSANPYFARMASSSETTVLADAAAQNPTFFSIWIGNNDVLTYAISGGTGVDQTGNLNPASYANNDITDPNVFAATTSQVVSAMTANGAKGVVINIPDVTKIPFFTTVPNNALVLNAEQAQQLTLFFQAVAGITTQGLIDQGVPAAQAQQIASQYAITFNEGPNRWLIDTPASQTNPLGFRQMTEEERIVLTIDQTALRTAGYGSVAISNEVLQVLGKLQAGATITEAEAGLVLAAINGIDDKDALDNEEINAINTARSAYNTTLSGLAQQNDLILLDFESLYEEIVLSGYQYNGGEITTTFGTGGAFSLDGIHLTPRGYAVVADEIIRAINESYDANIPGVDPGNYPTIFVQ